MSEAFRFLNEYGDLSRLPLFSQLTADEQSRVIDGVISYNLVAA